MAKTEDQNNIIFDLDKDIYIIDGENKIFEDTPFQNLDFKVVVEPLMRRQYNLLHSKFTKFKHGDEITDNVKLDAELFKRQTVSWEGINDVNGKAIPCNDDTKKLFLEKKYFFCKLISLACQFFQTELEEKKEKLVKN